MFKRMPEELAGMRVRRGGDADGAGVTYGTGGKSTVAWASRPSGEIKDPRDDLAVGFGLGLACKKGAYAGTAPQSSYGPVVVPAGARGADSVEGLYWFSCGAALDEDGKRHHAIGWVSGDLAWLAISPDERTSKALIDAMIEAR